MIIKRISLNATAAGAEYFVNIVTLFVVYKIIISELGISVLGLWSLIISIFSLTDIGNTGFTNSLLKFIAKYKSKNDDEKVKQTIETTIITVFLISSIAISIIYLFLYLFRDTIFTRVEYEFVNHILFWILPALLLSIIGRVFLSALDGLILILQRSIIGIISRLVYLFLCIVLINKLGIVGLAISYFFQYLILLLFAGIKVKQSIPTLNFTFLRFNKNSFKEIFNYGVQLQLSGIFQLTIDPVIKYTLKKYGGLESVGIFEIVYKLFLHARALSVVIINTLIPVVASMYETAKSEVKVLYLKTFNLTFIVSILSITLVFSILPLLLLYLNVDMNNFVLVNAVFIYFGTLFNLLAIVPFIFNQGLGNTGINTIFTIVLASFNLILCYFAGLVFSELGVLLGFCISQLLGALTILLLFLKKEGINSFKLLTIFDVILFITSSLTIMVNLIIMKSINHKILMIIFNLGVYFLFNVIILYYNPMVKQVWRRIYNSSRKYQ